MQIHKKIQLGICCGLMALSVGSFAGTVSIQYNAIWGFYFTSDSGVGILGAGTGNETIAQLIFSPDNQVDPALVGGLESGNDSIWGSTTVKEGDNSSEWAEFSGTPVITNFVSGFIYARIFQDANIQAGDSYYFTTPIALIDDTLPQGIADMNYSISSGHAIDAVGANNGIVMIPEPTTGLLLAVGGGVAWLVRLRQRLL